MWTAQTKYVACVGSHAMDLGVFTCKVSLTEKEYTDTLSVMFRNQFNYVTVYAAL